MYMVRRCLKTNCIMSRGFAQDGNYSMAGACIYKITLKSWEGPGDVDFDKYSYMYIYVHHTEWPDEMMSVDVVSPCM